MVGNHLPVNRLVLTCNNDKHVHTVCKREMLNYKYSLDGQNPSDGRIGKAM